MALPEYLLTHPYRTNFFGKGNTTVYDRAIYYQVSTPQDTFHTYTIDWTSERLEFIIDGVTVRTLAYDDPLTIGGTNYPQTPMRLKLGNWCGGCAGEAEGTVEWAGGNTTFDNAPYTMYVESVTIQNNNPADSYQYGDMTGDWQSIKVISGNSSAGASGASSTVSATGSGTASSAGSGSATLAPTSSVSVAGVDQTAAAVSSTQTGSAYSMNTASASAQNTGGSVASASTQVPGSSPSSEASGSSGSTGGDGSSSTASSTSSSPATQTGNSGASINGILTTASLLSVALGFWML